MLMVKPALAYLDVIRRVREASTLPLAAYNVSGEFSAVKAAAERGWLDEAAVVRENLQAIARAGRRHHHHVPRARGARREVAVNAGPDVVCVDGARRAGAARRRELAGARVPRRRRHAAGDPVGGRAPSSRTSTAAGTSTSSARGARSSSGTRIPRWCAARSSTRCRAARSFGAPCEPEIELAEFIVASYPGLEQVRFVSSGTEATMSAIRVARGATGRDRIVKFSGCYHGHADHLLVAAGSGLVTFGRPSSAGVPEAFARETVVLPLDDEQRLADYLRAARRCRGGGDHRAGAGEQRPAAAASRLPGRRCGARPNAPAPC